MSEAIVNKTLGQGNVIFGQQPYGLENVSIQNVDRKVFFWLLNIVVSLLE